MSLVRVTYKVIGAAPGHFFLPEDDDDDDFLRFFCFMASFEELLELLLFLFFSFFRFDLSLGASYLVVIDAIFISKAPLSLTPST